MLAFCLNCGREKVEKCKFCIRCGSELAEVSPLTIFEPGAHVDNRYEIKSLLRETDFGLVYKAEDLRFNTLCIVKELLLNYKTDDFKDYLEKIRQEIKLFSSTRHPCLPAITNYFVHSGRHFLVTDYFEGKALDEILAEKGQPGLPEENVLSWTVQILDMLDYFHHQEPPIIYRDIDPASIMVKDQDKRIIFLDFYISSADPEAQGKGILPSGNYSAPEEKKGEFSVASDIFSVGATMYHLLTGKMKKFSDANLRPITTILPDLNPEMAAITCLALKGRSEERFASAQDMKKSLLAVFQDADEQMAETVRKPETTIEEEPVIEEKPSVIKPPPVIVEKPKITMPIISAETKPVPVPAITEPMPLPSVLKDSDITGGITQIDTLEEMEKRSELIKKVFTGVVIAGVILAVIFGYFIIDASIADKHFLEGMVYYEKALEGKNDYISKEGGEGQGGTLFIFPIDHYTDAIGSFHEYIKKRENSPEGYYMVGQCYFGIYEMELLKGLFKEKEVPVENLEKARTEFKSVILKFPDYVPAHYYLARCYYNQGDLVNAKKELDTCIQLLSDTDDEDYKALWAEKVDKALLSFFDLQSVTDASINGARLELVNACGQLVKTDLSGQLDNIPPGEKIVKDVGPGEFTLNVEIGRISYSELLNLEKNHLYIINLTELHDRFDV